jgi:Spy/CpxP family protein refolding chaperone
MQVTGKDKWQVGTAVLLIFALGFIAGALALNLYRTYHPAASGQPRGRQRHLEQVIDTLSLSDDQKAQVKQIFSDTRKQLADLHQQSNPAYAQIRQQAREKLKAVMTPEQWDHFQQVMKEGWDNHGGGGGGGEHGDHGGRRSHHEDPTPQQSTQP